MDRPAPRFGPPEALVAVAVVAFFALIAVWLGQDHRVPSWDPGGHMYTALWFRERIADGDVLFPFEYYNAFGYPPLTYLTGAGATVLFGRSVETLVLSQSVIFVPLLALGCYGAGLEAFRSRWAGALAAVFGLGTPLLASLLHIYMLDPPQTAMAAVTVWLLLRSRRFERRGVAAAAGVAFGLGMLTKLTFVVFPAGLIAVMVLRGGWRNRAGMAWFAGCAVVVGAPYYLRHFSEVLRYSTGANVGGTSLGDFGADPARFSLQDAGWYLWNAINIQLLLPFTLLLLVGLGLGLWRFWRTRAADDYTPELAGGLLLAYVVITMLAHNDSRYMLPATVYAAVLGTGWIATASSRTLRIAGGVAVVAIAVANVVMPSRGIGGELRVDLPSAQEDRVSTRSLTLLRDTGFLQSEPIEDGRVQEILAAAADEGATQIAIGRLTANESFFNIPGVTALGAMEGLAVAPGDDPSEFGPADVYLRREAVEPGGPEPCAVLSDGSGVFFTRGPELAPLERAPNLWCPRRTPATYAGPEAGTPLPPDVRARLRALTRELRAAHADGVRYVGFEESMATDPDFGDGAALYAAARRAGLEPPPGGGITSLQEPEGMLVFQRAIILNSPEPCLPAPDDAGVYLVRGHVTPQMEYAEALYCPTRTPAFYKGPLADA